MATLDEEWLGKFEPDIVEKIDKAFSQISQGTLSPHQLNSVLTDCKITIATLRMLVKHQDKRIDDLTKELDAIMEPDDDDR
jgi:hypothetical protein